MPATDFYNAVLGEPANRPLAMVAMAMLKHHSKEGHLVEFPRYRDAYFAYDVDGVTPRIVVLTRTGGGNREDYQSENNALTDHPLYVRDADDDFDCTYALWWFAVPEDDVASVKEHLAETGQPPSLKERTDAAIAKIKETGVLPDLSGMKVISSDGSTSLSEFLARQR